MFELASRRQWAWLANELAQWTKDGIITDDQQQRILDKYGRHGATSADSTYQTDARQTSIVARIVAPLGALMIGAGVIMLLAHNWKSMAVWLKLALAGSAMVAAYGVGYWLAFERRTHAAVGRALILLGILLFGANIWLAAQVFNISADSSGGVLLWAIGALLVAHVLQDRPVAYLSMALLTLWTVLDHAQRVDPRSYLFPMIMAGAGLPLVLSLKSRIAAVQAILSVVVWLAVLFGQQGVFGGMLVFVGAIQVFFLLLYEAARAEFGCVRRAGLGPVIRAVAVTGGLIATYVFTFSSAEEGVRTLRDLYPAAEFLPPVLWILLPLAVAGCTMLAVTGMLKAPRKDRKSILEHSAVLLLLAATVAYFAMPTAGRHIHTIAMNVIYVGVLLGVLGLGTTEGNPTFINMAVGFLLLNLMTRYFDVFWTLVHGSMFFIAGGTVLLISALLLERQRRNMIRRARAVNPNE